MDEPHRDEPNREDFDERARAAAEDADPVPPARDDETELEQVIREREELRASWQRAQADYQNLKRRQTSDVESAVRRELVPLLEGVLEVLDHLDLALETECRSEDAKNLAVGVRMTRDQLALQLERHQVARIPTEGAFDPNLHQAVATVATGAIAPGQVVEVVRTGWKYRDVVLRPAHVKVSTAPSEEGEKEPGAAARSRERS